MWPIHWHREPLSKQSELPCSSPSSDISDNPVFILIPEQDRTGAVLKTTPGPAFSILDVNFEIFVAALSMHDHQRVIFLLWTY